MSAASSAGGSLLQPMSAASGPYSAFSSASQAGAQGDVVTGWSNTMIFTYSL